MKTLWKLLAVTLIALSGTAFAQDGYPNQPLKIVVPTNTGGSIDTLARIFQKKIDAMGIYPSVIVVNQPGAGGTIGTRAVKDADPDGYTIGVWQPGIITSKAMGVVDYDHTAFTVLGGTAKTEIGMGVLDSSVYKTPGDLVAASKTKPNSVAVATNIGLPVHFIPLMFASEAGIEMKFVQIGGGSKRLASILGGHTDTGLFSVSEFQRFKESGLRPLFLYADRRDPSLPDVPTAKESGVNLQISVFRLWLAPKGLDPKVQAKLQDVLKGVVSDPEIIAQLEGMSINPGWLYADEVMARLDEMKNRAEPLAAAARSLTK